MAILGKRSRPSTETEASLLPSSRPKRSRLAKPNIHIEDGIYSAPEEQDVQSVESSLQDSSSYPAASKSRSRTLIATPLASNDENIPPQFQTPSATRFRDALAPVTPKHRVRIGGRPKTPRTPQTPRVGSTPSRAASVYAIARQAFSQGAAPPRLIGRSSEKAQLTQFVTHAIESRRGGSIYVNGPPGTGKSAVVEELVAEFSVTPTLRTSVINCVSMKSKDVLQQLISELCPSAGARSEKATLAQLFTRKSQPDSFLVVLDEVDSLVTQDVDTLYDLFGWALHPTSRLILVGIANALDLTDRCLPQLKAKNLKPQLLPFMPYTAPQIASIVTEKLKSTLPGGSEKDFVPFVHPMAIQLCSKKVASQTGDIRKVFNLIRRAIDSVESETMQKQAETPTKQPFTDITNTSPNKFPLSPPPSSPLKGQEADLTPVTAPRASIGHIAKITSAVFNSGAVSRLSALNVQQKAVLCSLVVAEGKRRERNPLQTPSKNANKRPMVKALFASYAELCKRDNVLSPLSSTEFRDVVAGLETLGLVQEVGSRTNFLTPTKTPSRLGRTNPDEKQFTSTVSERELAESLEGPGAEVLKRLLCSR